MKVLSSEQIKIADKNSILIEPISSIDFMERAAEKCCELFPPKGQWSHLVVICGTGNNGGDGLAIARLQMENFKSVRVLVIESSKNYSDNFNINLKRLQDENCNIQFVESAKDIYLHEEELVVDAILGTGVSRPVDSFLSSALRPSINKLHLQLQLIFRVDCIHLNQQQVRWSKQTSLLQLAHRNFHCFVLSQLLLLEYGS